MEIKPLEKLTKKLIVLLKIYFVVAVIAVFAGFFEFYTYKTLPVDFNIDEEVLASDMVTGIVGLIQIVIYVVLAITFLKWIYRTNNNLWVLSGIKLKFTPGWSIGWYFIPIVNMYKPYQAMKEIWNVSRRNKSDSNEILGWWWSLWLVSIILGRIAFRLTMRAEDLDSYLLSTMTCILSDGVDIVLTAVALMLVVNIWTAYSNSYEKSKNLQEDG